MLALPIFPGRRQPSIVGANELNFRVRDGNGWTLVAISTNYCSILTDFSAKINIKFYFFFPIFILIKTGDP